MIVEDDDVIASSIERHLSTWGWDTVRAKDLRRVAEEFVSLMPHIVLMDVGLPFFNGYHWCAEIRKLSSVPVIFISSAGDDMNIVMALNMGADDYVVKPFKLEVLTAKIQASLRRAYDMAAPTPLSCRGAVLSAQDASLIYNGKCTELTRNEYRILQVLMENVGNLVKRETLMERLWETDIYVDDNTLAVNMTRLRHKLAGVGLSDMITTRRGAGYLVE